MTRLRKIKGKYYAYFYDPTRSPKEKSYPLRTGSKAIAKKKLFRLENEFADGKLDPWGHKKTRHLHPTSEVIQSFVSFKSGTLRPSTIKAYDDILTNWQRRLPPGLPLRLVKPEHLEGFISDDSVRPHTRHKRFRHVKAFLNWAAKQDYLDDNPIMRVAPPKVGKAVPKFLQPSQLEAILIAIDVDKEMRVGQGGRVPETRWVKDLILLALSTGMRLGELLSLRWNAIDFEGSMLVVRNTSEFTTKSGDERRIPLSKSALEVLRRRYEANNSSAESLVLTNSGGNQISLTYASQRFKHYSRLAKLPDYFHFHCLRHTCASWLAMKGESMHVIKAILGHSSIAVTEQYAHLAPDVSRRAINATFSDVPVY